MGGLGLKYSNIDELQQFTMFDEACVLAHKIEQQQKNKPYKREFPKPHTWNQPFKKRSFNPSPKAPTSNFANP